MAEHQEAKVAKLDWYLRKNGSRNNWNQKPSSQCVLCKQAYEQKYGLTYLIQFFFVFKRKSLDSYAQWLQVAFTLKPIQPRSRTEGWLHVPEL